MTGPATPGSDPRETGRASGGPFTPGTTDPLNPGASAPSEVRPEAARYAATHAAGQPAAQPGSEPMRGYEAGRHTSGQEPLQVPLRQPWNAGIADPGPLGLAGFALTTMVLSVFNSALLPAGGTAVVLGLTFFYGGLAQVLAGMWEFVKGNTFGAVAFTSYGAFWLSFWYLVTHESLITADPGDAVGLYLFGWTVFTAYMTIAALRTTGIITAVFVALTITFALLTVGDFAASTTATHIGGYVGLATAALAWYASFAGVINATFRKTVLPVFPLNV